MSGAKRKVSDKRIVKIARDFREGILDGGSPHLMCFAVSAPLAGLLRFYGVPADVVKSDLGWIEHYWIRLSDGRALDPTADQFNGELGTWPPVYLGEPDAKLHTPPTEGKR
jgi:hypothetical protein